MRARVERVLGAAALEPPGLPPASILVVRSLSDPLPGRMAPRSGGVRPSAEWEAAVRSVLAERWRGAARPARGFVPAGAEAVFFADRAELIAAFARDACAGGVERWWWRALLRGLPAGPLAALAALWTREARHVPAALDVLASSGDAVRVVSALGVDAAVRVLGAAVFAWEAQDLLASRVDAGGSPAPPSEVPVPAVSSAPWSGFLPPDAVPRGLAREQAALLGVGLMLQRAPLVARSGWFVERFVAWRAAVASTARSGDEDVAAPDRIAAERRVDRGGDATAPLVRRDGAIKAEDGVGSVDSVDPVDLIDSTDSIDRIVEIDRIDGIDGIDPVDADGPRMMSVDDARNPPRPHIPLPRVVEAADRDASAETVASIEVRGEKADGQPIDSDDRTSSTDPVAIDTPRTASGACGIFFLINVLRSMELFRHLDTHFRVPPTVGGWAWIELVARALMGPAAGGLADDPLWRLLAELDGRAPDQLPGGGFAAPATHALPDRWTARFGGTPPAPAPSPPLGLRPAPDLQRFLDTLIPPLRTRISAALAAAGADPDEPLETVLLRRTGIVEATRSHVDVHIPLDEVTLPVRLAGLDATPGWVPELARVVTFHFA